MKGHGTAGEYLNGYAYLLLTIHYMQSTSPPVVPNLQQPGEGSVPVLDNKWGGQQVWRPGPSGDVVRRRYDFIAEVGEHAKV